MVDALPYLVDYPYGCTEQTLNRFLPTVITQRMLQDMKLDLKDDPEEADQPQRPGDRRRQGTGQGLEALSTAIPSSMRQEVQEDGRGGRRRRWTTCSCADGGWGWFSGYGEHSWPHTTAVVVHGLQIAKAQRRGVAARHAGARRRLAQELPGRADPPAARTPRPRPTPTRSTPTTSTPWSTWCWWMPASTATRCATSSTATARSWPSTPRPCSAWRCTSSSEAEKLAMILKNIEQYVVQDDENQTAYLGCRRTTVVVLVRQRDRGQRLLSQAAGRAPARRTRRPRGWSSIC